MYALLAIGVGELVYQPKENGVSPIVFWGIVALVIWMALGTRRWKSRLIDPGYRALAEDPKNEKALRKVRAGYFLNFCYSIAVVVYGLFLRFLGSSRGKVIPFYVVGIAMILVFTPRRPTHLN